MFIFLFAPIAFGVKSKKMLQRSKSRKFLHFFFFLEICCLSSYFHFLKTHFELIFMYGVRQKSILLLWLSGFPHTTYWRYCLFPSVYPSLICHILVEHICLSYFLAFYSIPLSFVFIFMLTPYCFDYCSFAI